MSRDRTIRNHLNRCMPVARDARLGDVFYDLINKHNALVAQLVTATTLTADQGVALTIALPSARPPSDPF